MLLSTFFSKYVIRTIFAILVNKHFVVADNIILTFAIIARSEASRKDPIFFPCKCVTSVNSVTFVRASPRDSRLNVLQRFA